MQLVKADDLFREARELLEGRTVHGAPCEQDVPKAEALLNEILTNNLGNPLVLHVLGSLHLAKRNFGLAVHLLSSACQQSPEFGDAWNNLGLAFKEVNHWDEAVECAKKAATVAPMPDILCNVAGLHINRGMPDQVLEWAEKALAKAPNHVKAQWHKAMALLEMGEWSQAWDYHESRLTGGANENIAERNYHGPDGMTPWWDGHFASWFEINNSRKKGRATVVIHGEQGMGDEIMFATCIPDAIATGAEIVFEPSPRLAAIFKRSFPEIIVHGTDAVDGTGWIEERGPPDFKIALGSLPKFYRRSPESFPSTPYLVPCPEKKAFWDGKLAALGNKPRIGLTWQGGVPSTRVDVRSFHPRILAQLFRHDVQWVSLQYDQTAQGNVADIKQEFGIDIAHWPKAVEARDPETGAPSDLDELAALVSCLDLVISVPQTAYHVAGALGVPCWVMTQSEPDWRLGVEGDSVPWYDCIYLSRQAKGSRDWMPVITDIDNRLEEFLHADHARISRP